MPATPEGFVIGAQVAGRYVLVRPLGTGGMGEVFEADDLLVGTRIALKVLRADHCGPSAIERLRRELALARKITHSNVCRIHDLGQHEGRVFLTMELLKGETLAERLTRGPLPIEEARAILGQLAAGLDAAHAAGVIHRDFKSANVILVASRAVVTDFGLARSEIAGEYSQLTAEAALLGTPAYMSPEQVEGKPATTASDVYSFGVVAYELVTGRLPFRADTPLATASLRLTSRPPRPSSLRPGLPPAWDEMIARCLSRRAERRFAMAGDAIAHLDRSPSSSQTWAVRCGAGLLIVASVFGGGLLLGHGSRSHATFPTFMPITHGRGTVYNARFARDGRIVYAAAWNEEPVTTYLATPPSLEARVLFGPGTSLLSIAPDDRIALIIDPHARDIRFPFRGTLAVTSLAGGEPRPLVEDVYAADWRPDDDKPALVRLRGLHDLVEFPYGHQVLDRDQGIPGFRVSHDGTLAAVSINDGAAGKLALFDASGRSRILVEGWRDIRGLAWSASDQEVWFTGRPLETSPNVANALYAVDLAGNVRELLRSPGSLMLHDIAGDGRVLLAEDVLSREAVLHRGERDEQALSWFDDTTPVALSDDGGRLLFDDLGGIGLNGQTYQRRLDGSLPVMLSDSPGYNLSADGELAVVYDPAHQDSPERLLVVPTRAAEHAYGVRPGRIQVYRNAAFSSDGRRLVTVGIEDGAQATPRFYIQDLPDGDPRPISPHDSTLQIAAQPVSPDGAWIFGHDGSGGWHIYSTTGNAQREIPTMTEDDMVLRWSAGGRLLVARKQQSSVDIAEVDPIAAVRQNLFTVRPADPAGVEMPPRVVLTPDAKTYAYSYWRRLSRLYVVTGLH